MSKQANDDDDDPYPEVPIDAAGFDRLVRMLSDMDEPHHMKAVGLVLAARTEHHHAVEGEELPDTGFSEFVDATLMAAADADSLDWDPDPRGDETDPDGRLAVCDDCGYVDVRKDGTPCPICDTGTMVA